MAQILKLLRFHSGLVVNWILNMIAASLGWRMGGALPAREEGA
jgi:hypothetical protein